MPSKPNLNRAMSLLLTSSLVYAAPCDIYNSGKTPCVAAHSTTRALYDAYDGPLYEVKRASDNSTIIVKPLSPGGIANATTQDAFCTGTSCLITTIYDQSSNGNHLTDAPGGSNGNGPLPGGFDNLANATAAPIKLSGHKAYGVYIKRATGYRNDVTHGIAKHDEPEGLYAVLDGTHYDNGCCFDYGNAETNNRDPGAGGAGHMEAIYFGNAGKKSTGTGPGPWVMADLENGIFASNETSGANPTSPSISSRFVTAFLKGKPDEWAIRGCASAAHLPDTYWSGPRPKGYSPMQKEGAIVLGVGGDNSRAGQGTFYEGVMTSGYPTDATENAVQANIAAARYAA